MRPAQEDVTRFLHQALPLDDPISMVGVGTVAKVGFKRRSICFLDLQEEWVISVPSCHEQYDPAARSDTAYSYHLAGDVDSTVAADQHFAIIWQRLHVRGKVVLDPCGFILLCLVTSP